MTSLRNSVPESLISESQIQSLVEGRHSDVFSVLGLHLYRHNDGADVAVLRVFLPNAQTVEAIDAMSETSLGVLDQVNPAGLFQCILDQVPENSNYQLKVQYADDTFVLNDPYRFPPQLSDEAMYLFCEGTEEKLYQWMGAHHRQVDGVDGVLFAVWAPNASRVSVVGDFNFWDGRCHGMRKHLASGVWELFIPDLGDGVNYKYEIRDIHGNTLPQKADPCAFAMQHPPNTASTTLVAQSHCWSDESWMAKRASSSDHYREPVSIYEVHAGSWRRHGEENNRYLTFSELASQLIPYVKEMGFTHIQFMPMSEYPFDGSWGYQPIGLFAPSSRFGSAEGFKAFIDDCHQQGIGVLLDWVPGHFPMDEHGLGRFDGTCLYEHEDKRKGYHPDWKTLIYNYGRAEVRSFLISNAMYWLDEFHLDGLRVDAVASMLYLDYSREPGEWIPNQHGGRENLEAIELLQQVNNRVYFNYPGVMMVAEESTAWPGVSRPTSENGLGFGFKWNMGWMNDTLEYMSRDPIYRQYHHGEMTFSLVYSFSENFVLPLSHDEVVHGKGSLINKMPGDIWQKFANLRVYLAFMWTHPGKKLLFMGSEFAQEKEWNHDQSLDWHLLEQRPNSGIKQLVQDLNRTYRDTPALHQRDCEASGFQWLDSDNNECSILTYLRIGEDGSSPVLVVVNLTPTAYQQFQIGVPMAGQYVERLNTDSDHYGGSNMGNAYPVASVDEPWHGQPRSIHVVVPPLAAVIFDIDPMSTP